MGATAVLEMAAATPPAKKSFRKLVTASDMAASFTQTQPGAPGNPTSQLQVDDALPPPRVS